MLYYPFAEAPLPILHRAVLYWDYLATVVGPEWESRISDRTREIHDAGLYRPIEPYASFEPVPLDAIRSELEQALKKVQPEDLVPPSGPPDERTNVLHPGKLHKSVIQELLSRGLAHSYSAPGRLASSPALVNIVVSLTAAKVAADANMENGCTGEDGLWPHTDTGAAHRLSIEPTGDHDVTACWRVDIGPLLPVPDGDVMISDLLRHRQKYDAERRQMMRAIDELLHELRRRHPADAFQSVKRTLEQASEDWCRAASANRKLRWVYLPLAVSVATAATYMAGGSSVALASLLGTVSGISINVATDRMRQRGGRFGESADFRYLHHTNQLVKPGS